MVGMEERMVRWQRRSEAFSDPRPTFFQQGPSVEDMLYAKACMQIIKPDTKCLPHLGKEFPRHCVVLSGLLKNRQGGRGAVIVGHNR